MKRLTFKKMLDMYDSIPTKESKKEFLVLLGNIDFKDVKKDHEHYARVMDLESHIYSEWEFQQYKNER